MYYSFIWELTNNDAFQMKQKRKQMKKEGKSTVIPEDEPDKVSFNDISAY